METRWRWDYSLSLLLLSLAGVRGQCSKQDYQYCVKLADPLLKDPHLIYPDNAKDIEHVCRTWSFFVDCVKVYTERCFTEAKRQEFNKAVESPVNSIHRLCSMPDYRDDYMKHASCMKMTLTQDSHCGRHYKLLVSQVSGEAARSSICCSHHMFRECVIDQTRSSCEPDAENFSAQVLDKALSFLRNQCSNFVPNKYDCPGADFYRTATGRADMSTTISDQNQHQHITETKHVTPSTTTTTTTTSRPWIPQSTEARGASSTWTKQEWTSPSWMPGGNKPKTTESSNHAGGPNPPTGSGERTTFSRGIAWDDNKGTTGVGGVTTATPGPPWRQTPQNTYTWYPSSKANDYKETNNAIDEPNQQGLGSEDNSATTSGFSYFCVLLSLLVFTINR